MKKTVGFWLVLCLCLAAVFPAAADTASSEAAEKLILSAKEKFSISDETFVFENYYLEESERGNRYSLNWVSKDEYNGSNINVEMLESGAVERYYRYDGTKERNRWKYPQKTEEQALEAAKQFLASIDAEKAGQTAEGEMSYDSYEHSYCYRAERILGGFPVFGESLTLQLDADTLELIYYDANWTEGVSVAAESFLSAEKAADIYREKLGYELFYQVVTQDGQDVVKTVYRPKYEEALAIDAVSGEVLTAQEALHGNAGGSANNKYETSSAAQMDMTLSAEERAALEEMASMLSAKEAEQIARSVSEFEITKDYQAENYSISKNAHGSYVGTIRFRLENEENYGYRNVGIDVKSGEVLSFNGYEGTLKGNDKSSEKAKKEQTPEQSQQAVENFLKRYAPDKLENMTRKQVWEPSASSVSYLRVENGTKVFGNGATFSFDTDTGKLRSFSLEWTEAEFPQVTGVRTESVYEKLLTAENFRCGYLISYDTEKKEPFAKALYQTEENPVFDAESLQKLDWRLRPVTEAKRADYTDLSGHYAEEAVKKLAVLGIGYEGSLLRPNEAVTQGEYLKLIAQVCYQRSWDSEEELYQYFIRKGVLMQEEVHPEAEVSRMEGIRYLLNVMGYREFANISGIFLCPFSDVSEADKGYGAIAAGLGLVEAQSDCFYADSALRRADSLIIMYRYLNRSFS